MRHVDHLLAQYHDRELSLRCCWQIEKHVEACPTCQAELERLRRLSGLLAECTLPDTLTGPETFRAQVALRLPRRRATRAPYVSWTWLAVPVSLICVLMIAQGLFVLPGIVVSLAAFSEWGGIDAFSRSAPLLSGAIGSGAMLSYVMGSPVLFFLWIAWQIFLCWALILIFVPYVGWVNVLVRSSTRPIARKGESDGLP